MVKGISRQVIVVRSPDPEMFEQAIFILREGQKEITDDILLKEASRLIGRTRNNSKHLTVTRLISAAVGALLTGLVWVVATLI